MMAYQEAAERAENRHAYIVSSYQQVNLLKDNGFPVPDMLLNVLKPPTVVIFTGHMVDTPDRSEPRFPPQLEAAVRLEIDRYLDDMDARIGYCSAACGSDLVFIEAMQDRDAEVNIVLPFDIEDFLETSLHHGGPHWVARFRRAVKLATSVKYVTEERYLQDDVLFDFAGRILQGYALLRAKTLETSPYLLTVWDGNNTHLVGGTAHNISRWPDPKRLRVIRTENLLKSLSVPQVRLEDTELRLPIAATTSTDRASSSRKRVIKTMLFADVVGYSVLQDQYMPFYMYEFLERIAVRLKEATSKPEVITTWGDAIFVVMSGAIPLTEYAFALLNAVCATDWTDLGFPAQMNVRIALHAGPVFEGIDPIIGKPNFYGSHVNRAARIEPVTVPGCVYASEQFAALLTSEQCFLEHDSARSGKTQASSFVCEYVGTLSLPKSFGSQATYHIRKECEEQSKRAALENCAE
jgi:class 3 adenylate cyclase